MDHFPPWSRLQRSSTRPSRADNKRTNLLSLLSCSLILAATAPAIAADDPWAPFVEPDFPFFSSSLDLRREDPNAVPANVTPRGVVLNLGHDCWACFDTDLLRVSAIWQGPSVSEDALAQLSYQNRNLKTVGGQSKLPKPQGTVWMINGVYPGWQIGEKLSLEDKREPQPSKEEPGRGPIQPWSLSLAMTVIPALPSVMRAEIEAVSARRPDADDIEAQARDRRDV